MEPKSEEVLKAEEDAAFLAEMANPDLSADAVIVQEPAVIVPAAGQIADEPKEVVTEEPAVPDRKEVIAGYTEDELKSALAMLPKLQKALDTTNGTLGSRLADQQRALDELREQRQKTGTLSADKLTRLGKEFPELASMLAEDLNEYIAQGAPDAVNTEQFVKSRMDEMDKRLVEMEQAREIKALTRKHADWRQVASYTKSPEGFINWANPAFGNWVTAQPDETRTRIVSEWDADFLTDQLSKFKEETKPKVVKKEVIEAAVMPRGAGGKFIPAVADEEEAAFRAEMAKR